MNNSFVFDHGARNSGFVVFNPLEIELVDETPVLHEVKIVESEFWNTVKSKTWSCGCRFFFVINTGHIVIGNVHDNEAFICSNLSSQIFDEFLKTVK
ncbi:MAG: hypothetical protein KA270_02895 [Saprospiraceae bacterium]|nr:hypothetical protein [Saprospiraceae bacterium]